MPKPFALSTLVRGFEQKSSCMVELHKFLRIKSAHKPESCMLEDFWGKHAKEVGLLVSERLVNIPIELAPPLYQGLFDEVLWATEDEVNCGCVVNITAHRLTEYQISFHAFKCFEIIS